MAYEDSLSTEVTPLFTVRGAGSAPTHLLFIEDQNNSLCSFEEEVNIWK